MKKDNQFAKHLAEKQLDEKYANQINKVRSILIENNDFANISISSQFKICFDVCLIAIQTTRHDLSIMARKKPNENDFKYSIYSKITELKTDCR